jgi:hypothetical protein
MPPESQLAQTIAADLEQLAVGSPTTSLARAEPQREADAVFIQCRYLELPTLGEVAWDLEQFDLAVRRASLATLDGFGVHEFGSRGRRIRRRSGLRLREGEPGSLRLLTEIPGWIVEALASQPATAASNLIALLGVREALRVRVRDLS